MIGNIVTECNEISQRDQKGETAMVSIGRFVSYGLDVGCDYTGLGRWSWILVGSEEKKTRIMVAYQPSALKNKNTKGFTVFEQQERYFESHGDRWSPRTIFYKQYVAQLRIWCQQEEEIILCGDFNEHVYEGRLAQ